MKSLSTISANGITNNGNTLTVPVSGRYLVLAQQLVNGSNNGYWSVQRNGSDYKYAFYTAQMGGSIGNLDLNVCCIMQCNAGDTIRINQTSALANAWTGQHSSLSVELLG